MVVRKIGLIFSVPFDVREKEKYCPDIKSEIKVTLTTAPTRKKHYNIASS